MRDAIGGVYNLTFIAVFMLVISGYLAFSVSYNKAFKVKNKVISVLEQYEHYNENSKKAIRAYMDKIGYNASSPIINESKDGTNWKCPPEIKGVCYKWTQTLGPKDNKDEYAGIPKGYFSVKTAVDIDVPIFNKFLPYMTFFQTQGDTMTIHATN